MVNLRTDGYPRPQFARNVWQSLNGEWEFEFDDAEDGSARALQRGEMPLKEKIVVPFAYQCAASGVKEKGMHEVVWYRKKFTLAKGLRGQGVLLCFNAVDFQATVWVNGKFVLSHTGGYTEFSEEISAYLNDGENVVVVRAVDRYDVEQPRGKQYWKSGSDRCWYCGTTGIWQSVWLEAVGTDYLDRVTILPDIETNSVSFVAEIKRGMVDALDAEIFYHGDRVKHVRFSLDGKVTRYTVDLKEFDCIDELHYWTVESPNLYDVRFRLLQGEKVEDEVETYFGFRKISRDENGNIYLNNIPLYQRLILDQGYWADTDLTPPSPESLRSDIEISKAMGFNGARKHQKVEDPYYYYYADKLGFLVWAEMPSAYCFNGKEMELHCAQYIEIVRQLQNHPSVVCFVPLNESWGVRKMLTSKRMQNYAKGLYHLTHALAPGQLVSTNDGWENVGESDILSVHDYEPWGESFPEKYREENLAEIYPMWRRLWARGEEPKKLPLIITEFGGVALLRDMHGSSWGYGGAADSIESFLHRLKSLFKGVYGAGFRGFCYTQLTDVKQEVNGLLDAHHAPKAPVAEIAKIVLNLE